MLTNLHSFPKSVQTLSATFAPKQINSPKSGKEEMLPEPDACRSRREPQALI